MLSEDLYWEVTRPEVLEQNRHRDLCGIGKHEPLMEDGVWATAAGQPVCRWCRVLYHPVIEHNFGRKPE